MFGGKCTLRQYTWLCDDASKTWEKQAIVQRVCTYCTFLFILIYFFLISGQERPDKAELQKR